MATPRPEAGKAGTTHVSFVCQRCRQPLKLDSSFQSLDQPLLTELTAPLACTLEPDESDNLIKDKVVEFDYEEDENIVKKVIGPSDEVDSSQEFTLLGETGPGSMENLSHRLKVTSYLFDVMSGQSDVDHPLCEECTDNLLDQLDQQLKVTEDECKDYRDFLEKLGTSGDEVDEEALDKELKQLQAEEDTLKQQLASVEQEREELVELIEKERKVAEDLEQQEEKYRKDYNEYKRQALELEDEQRSVDNQLRYAQAQLDKLKKTNVFNATFHIWHSGHFGTINNFRLGRLPSVPVDWNEINAAWGQTVLLLHSLARKMNLTFQSASPLRYPVAVAHGYPTQTHYTDSEPTNSCFIPFVLGARFRLVPYGNHSYLESLSDKSKELPLYGSGGFRFFWDTKFDQSMVAFLDCLQQFKEEVERGDTGFCLPYRMENGKIEDSSTGNSYSIKIQFNSEEQWTKALKFMLTNLKWGLAWVSSQFANK